MLNPNLPHLSADIEVELRTFNVASERIRHTLSELGAISLGAVEFKRAVMDVIPVDPDKWIRVRTEGERTTIAIKQRAAETSASGTLDKEVELEVEDFDKALALLEFLNGYTPRSIQENRRETFELDGTKVTIDSWPQLQDIVEIEAIDTHSAIDEQLAAIHKVADALEIPASELTSESVESFYKKTLGIDIKTTSLRFDVE